MTIDQTQSREEAITFINVLEIPQDEIEVFILKWKERARFTASAEGFISAELHEAIDSGTRFKVINVSRWKSVAHFNAATQAPAFKKELDGYQVSSAMTPYKGFYRVAVKVDNTHTER